MLYLDETGRNIVMLRKAQGISQEEAAYQAMLSTNRWQAIEYGCRNTTIDTLRRIAGVLGVAPITLGIITKSDGEILSVWMRTRQIVGSIPVSSGTGRNITALRKAKNITQKELSRISNVSCCRLRDIEHECANVTIAVLERIAEGLELTLEEMSMLAVTDTEVLEMVRKARIMAGLVV